MIGDVDWRSRLGLDVNFSVLNIARRKMACAIHELGIPLMDFGLGWWGGED
jgi:hypothetical protein